MGGQAHVAPDESPTPGEVSARSGDGSTDMTSAPTIPRSTVSTATVEGTSTVEGPREVLRLRLKPKAATTGEVDGGWWPRSRDLAVELPGLLAVLAVRLGRIERVSYHLGDWDPTPARLSVEGGVVRLGGYRTQHADTVDVLAARQRVTLLVVPPETSAQAAHEALMTAGRRGNTDDVQALLGSRRCGPPIVGGTGTQTVARVVAQDEAESAQQRWELDGGHFDTSRDGPAE